MEEGVRAKFYHFPSAIQTSQVLYRGADATRSNADVEHVMKSAPSAAAAPCSVKDCSQ